MKTVKLHINSCGYLQGTNPLAKPGPENLIYEIRDVPDDKPLPAVILPERSGLTQASISRIEDGADNLKIRTLRDLARALGCSVPDLLPDEDKQRPTRTRIV